MTVTDSKGCTTTASTTVTQPAALVATATGVDVTCNGANNGSASVTFTGGNTGHTYLWSTSATTSSISGLAPATYTVTVTDNKGCSDSKTVTINEPAVLSASATFTAVSCNGGADGTATVTPVGGNAGYSYSWNTSPAQPGATATGL